MIQLTHDMIRVQVADTPRVFYRGESIYENADLLCVEDDDSGLYRFRYNGNYGDYTITINLNDSDLPFFCDCPYPGAGCKHVVAALLTVLDLKGARSENVEFPDGKFDDEVPPEHLTYEEIKAQALEDRQKRAKNESFTVVEGDMYKDEHLLITATGKQYTVVLHDPETGAGHCSCPDYVTNRLGTCKHLIFLRQHLGKQKGFAAQVKKERFPFADIYWDSATQNVRLFCDRGHLDGDEVLGLLNGYFSNDGEYANHDLSDMVGLLAQAKTHRRIRIAPEVIKRVNQVLVDQQLSRVKKDYVPDYSGIQADLYTYQKEGVDFGLFKRSVLIGDEMGLGKTVQAITLCSLKKHLFGFKNVLIVTLASLKEQWHREIRKFTNESSVIVAGNAQARRRIYNTGDHFFKITNYEAVLRDVTIIARMKPDIVVLDEAQRIKNFNTKTADAVKQIPRQHAIVLTGTPLENKLEDVYSIVQFLDPGRVSPLWDFAGRYFLMSRRAKNKINGYVNLGDLRDRLRPLVIRRRKDEVLKDLPETVTNNYYVELTDPQEKMHSGFKYQLMILLSKKYLTPMDLQEIQMLLLKMRMVSNSTYLIDRKTHHSPKLKEFESIIHELAVENGRKVVVFSEWTTMTFLIAKKLSNAGIPFVELSGKIPVKKRQSLIDEFTTNPDCRVFLSTDAGGTGLNLQAADCVINFELPWNPAKLNQRTGRVNRIGQASQCINVINLISKRSIEESIYSGIEMKTDLFKGVFEDGDDTVDFSEKKKAGLLNQLRQMMGEEPDAVARPDQRPGEETPDDTPHFLNPKALGDGDEPVEEAPSAAGTGIDFTGEETDTEPRLLDAETGTEQDPVEIRENVFENQPAEKIETVLNSGMEFIGGLLEMATGRKIEKSDNQDKMLSIDRATGEVTMKFKLPGF